MLAILRIDTTPITTAAATATATTITKSLSDEQQLQSFGCLEGKNGSV